MSLPRKLYLEVKVLGDRVPNDLENGHYKRMTTCYQ